MSAGYRWGATAPSGHDAVIGYKDPEDPALKALDEVKYINSGLGTLGIL